MKYQKQGLDLIIKHTNLSQGRAMYQLNKQEDKIRVKAIYKNNNNHKYSYFKLASAYVIKNYNVS